MIILDTHTLIWWVDKNKKLSSSALRNIVSEYKKGELLISSISVWEIALLVKKGKLILKMDFDDWMKKIYSISQLKSVSVDNEIAIKSVQLEGLHPDPADRIIIATALSLNCPIVSKDSKIQNYKLVKTIW